MKHKIKNASAALLALLILLIVGFISMSGVVPIDQQKNFENIGNIMMLAMAVIGFFLSDAFLPLELEKNWVAIFSDITVSGISFLMNINIFGHEFNPERSGEGIWGWHIGWIICIIVQILVLTGLGKELITQIRLILSIICTIGRELGSLVSDIWNTIRNCNQRMLLVVFVGFIFWIIYGGALCNRRGVQMVFSDIDFWEKSALLWIRYLTVAFLLYISWLILQKVNRMISGTNGKAAMGIVPVIVLAVLLVWIPSLCLVMESVLLIPVTVTGALWAVIREIQSKLKGGNSDSNDFSSINKKDVIVVLILYILIPLIIVFGIAYFVADGSNIIGQDPTSITAWLEFFKVVADIAEYLIKFLI